MAQAHIRSRGPGRWQIITPLPIDPTAGASSTARHFAAPRRELKPGWLNYWNL